MHNDVVKDITALAKGDALAISSSSKVAVNYLRRQREGEPDREQEHCKPNVSDKD